MPISLSTGEFINFLMVGTMIATLFYTRRRHTKEDSDEVEKLLTTHLLDCARKNGEVETTLKRMETDMKRIERKVENVSAQIHAVTTGESDSLILMRRGKVLGEEQV